MANQDLMRIVDGIARDKNIERDQVYVDIEQAVASGLRKHFNTEDTSEFQVQVDRATGDISVLRQGQTLSLSSMGRIGAQTVKQVMIQLIRADERGSIYEEYKERVGTIVTGLIARFEGGTMIVTLGRVEGIMPRSEQIPGEAHQVGERVQALITEVRDTPSAIKIILSRAHPELIRRLFEREVPEVGERTIEIKALAREPGHRTKIAVSSIDSKVDAVGACVGVRGSRIKNIVDELGGEKIDIVRWNESSQILIGNALKPAEVAEVSLCFELGRATVVVNEDQLSLAIGKRGQNVRLAARLTGWDVDILTPPEFQAGVQRLDQTLKSIEGVTQEYVDKIIALGLIDVRDIDEVGVGPLMEEVGMAEELATVVTDRCAEEAKIVAVEQEAKKANEAAQKQATARALASGPASPRADESFTNPLLQSAVADDDVAEGDGKMPGALEATEGMASEITTHNEGEIGAGSGLSIEESAIHGVDQSHDHDGEKKGFEENHQTADLAEGNDNPKA
ncbi:MAG TPA: transcription termination factor NusA [Tepidisphaeraceae bacterium]|nr:transcription termination factor NusA [Tepidisphaeraceae bacterium]